MCGICGIVNVGAPAKVDHAAARRTIRAMLEALAHRGPDRSDLLESGAAVLGATRLAIRGIEDGDQPMAHIEGGLVAVCNGEIDNHAELRAWLAGRGRTVESKTDVAVIPSLYLELGDAFVERLSGVFALAIWDANNSRLLLARDRVGERALFYTGDWLGFRFATEIAALASDPDLPLTPDAASLHAYVRTGCFHAPGSPFQQVRKVAPGEMIILDAGGLRHRRYWQWPIGTLPKRAPSVEAFDGIFRAAVRRQSEVDVDYGVFLSGGIDSSLVAAMARNLRPDYRLRAYTLRFEESSYDEGDAATEVARFLKLDPVSVWVRPESFPEEIAGLIRRTGEPLADPAWVPTCLLARRAAEDVKVALVGEGADELFGGYPTYLGVRLGQAYLGLPAPVRRMFRRAVEAWPPSDKKVTLSFLLKKFVQGVDLPGVARHLLWTASTPSHILAQLGIQPGPVSGACATGGELLDAVQKIDLETSLAEGLLTKADRGSMSSALELRAPFLDEAVVAFAATLPPEERVRRLTTKAFLKRYARQWLPPSIVDRRKRGLSVPLSSWLRGPLQGWARSCFEAGALEEVSIARRPVLDLFDAHVRRRADNGRALWTLLVLHEWLLWNRARPRAAVPPGDRP